jgi:hypothetical protein
MTASHGPEAANPPQPLLVVGVEALNRQIQRPMLDRTLLLSRHPAEAGVPLLVYVSGRKKEEAGFPLSRE